MPNAFFWYDLMTPDPQAAARFYGDVVGWGTEPGGVEGHDYTLFTIAEHRAAGLMATPPQMSGTPPCWTGYVKVDDLEATIDRLIAAGGTVYRPPTEVPGVIRFAVVADDQGAAFIIATPLGSDAGPSPAPGTPGTIGWHELYANDWQTAFAFYEKLFGWTKDTALDMGEMGTYQMFAMGGPALGGMMNKPSAMPMSFWQYYINVPAIDAAIARINAGGGAVLMGPQQVPGGIWIVQARDSQGGHFALAAPTR